MAPSYNLKNPAVKRILQEIKEVQADTSGDLMAEALETDIFEWHFAIRGPPDTDFEGGIYHGRILLPAEYPFKPPAFMMLSPSGRFETGVKICLSISTHHPEHWQPSWSVRTALTALIAFMPSPAGGALGSLEYTPEERRKLAAKSQLEPPKWGSPDRQQIINDMHERMLAVQPTKASSSATAAADSEGAAAAAAPGVAASTTEGPSSQSADATASAMELTAPAAAPIAVESAAPNCGTAMQDTAGAQCTAAQLQHVQQPSMPAATSLVTVAGAGDNLSSNLAASLVTEAKVMIACNTPAAACISAPARATDANAALAVSPLPVQQQPQQVTMRAAPQQAAPDTWGLTLLAVALGVLIAAIVLRKALVAVGYQPSSLLSASFDHDL